MSNQPGFRRPVSFFERCAVVAAEEYPPNANNLIIEGSGGLDPERLKKAVAAASQANPGSRLVLKSSWSGLHWEDSGRTPPVRIVDAPLWSGDDTGNAPFLMERLPADTGPTCEVVLVRGSPLRVAFRTHHAVMDGRGTMHWMDDIFRALRDEPVVGSRSAITDFELVKSLGRPRAQMAARRDLTRTSPAPTGRLEGGVEGFVSRRITVKGPVQSPLASLSLIIASQARVRSFSDPRIAISVDLRRRSPGLLSTANLVRDLHLDLAPGATVKSAAGDIRRQLQTARESSWSFMESALQHMTLGSIRLLSAQGKKLWSRGEYRVSALIANLGKVSLERFTGGGFLPGAIFSIPPGHPAYPLFIALFGYGDTIDLVATMPKGLATDGRFEELMTAIRSGFNGGPAAGDPPARN